VVGGVKEAVMMAVGAVIVLLLLGLLFLMKEGAGDCRWDAKLLVVVGGV